MIPAPTPTADDQRQQRAELLRAIDRSRTVADAAPLLLGLVGRVLPGRVQAFATDIELARAKGTPEAGLAWLAGSLEALERSCPRGNDPDDATRWALTDARHVLQQSIGLHGECERDQPCAVEGRAPHCRWASHRQCVRDAKAQEWSPLRVVDEGGSGLRHYLDDVDVHCGQVLELQAVETRYSDKEREFGYTYPLPRGVVVRYEASQDGQKISVALYADVGGHQAFVPFHDGMRFRWPPRDR